MTFLDAIASLDLGYESKKGSLFEVIASNRLLVVLLELLSSEWMDGMG